MKKYVSVASLIVFVVGICFVVSTKSYDTVAQRSVEFNIAEMSPGGEEAGYAMPASGGSPPSSKPGVVVGANPVSVDFGVPISVAWYHGTIPGATRTGVGGQGGRSFGRVVGSGFLSSLIAFAGGGSYSAPPPPPPPPPLSGILEGLSPWQVQRGCVAICDLDAYTCDQNNKSQWKPLDRNKNNTSVLKQVFALTDTTDTYSIPGVVNAGSGGASICKNANTISKTFTVTTNKSGNFLVGIVGEYTATYPDGDHTSTAQDSGSDSVMISVGVEPQPELIASIDIADQTFPVGSDVVLSSTLTNIGTGATDWKDAEDGLFNYVVKVDINNDGFTNGIGGDFIITSPRTVGPLAKKFHLSKPWKQTVSPVWKASDVVTGTHGIEVCVDQPSAVSEVQEGNNCTRATFTVESYDLAAVAVPGVYPAVYGEPLKIIGNVHNVGKLPVTTPFQNEIEIRNNSGKAVIDPAGQVDALDVERGIAFRGSGVDHRAVFGNTVRTLEYRVWVDTTDVIGESNDNVRPDASGNNVSNWSDLQLYNPEIRPVPVDRNGAATGYWGPFVYKKPMKLVFDILNETPRNLPLTTSFDSVLAIDTNGDCGASVSLSNGCIDDRVTFTTNGLGSNGAATKAVFWTTQNIGTYRARVYADSDDVLPEGNESNNTTGWIEFEVVESLPGQAVSIEASPRIVRKGQSTTLNWDVGINNPASCSVTKNDRNPEVTTLSAPTGSVTVTPITTTVYTVSCEPDGVNAGASEDVTVQVLPKLYES